jgi:DNA-binding CsgD family transcriptional regulator
MFSAAYIFWFLPTILWVVFSKKLLGCREPEFIDGVHPVCNAVQGFSLWISIAHMHVFSEALIELYETAESCSMESFASEVIRIMRRLIEFDGAVLGSGEGVLQGAPHLIIDDAYVANRDPLILTEYAQFSAVDPITHRFLSGLTTPLACQCDDYYRQKKLSGLQSLAAKYEIGSLLLFGNRVVANEAAKWLALYRSGSKRFGDNDKKRLASIWPHISRAIFLNRQAHLYRKFEPHLNWAVALINRAGAVEIADESFWVLLGLEWGVSRTRRVPATIMQYMVRGDAYDGKSIKIVMSPYQGYIVCQVQRKPDLPRLTRSEVLVARMFASGLSNAQIAKSLSLSQNTVRSHIAHAYDKLSVHSKLDLARLISIE